jgi:hypothetical protein
MVRKGKLKLIPSFTGALSTWKIFHRVKNVEKANARAGVTAVRKGGETGERAQS